MIAVQINSYGGTEVLELRPAVLRPTPGSDQVLIEAYGAGINPFDVAVRMGFVKSMMPLQFPATLGGDVSGVVVQLGAEVSDFKIGDEVYGQATLFNGGSGTFAQFVAANTKSIAKKPTSVNFLEAAALPLVGTSALQVLIEHMKLANGQKILIHGGAGGIGHIAIQLSKMLGAVVATTVGSKDIDYVKGLGADQVIDYNNEKFEDLVHDVDTVFDTVGDEVMSRSFQVLKRGGIIVSMRGQPDPALATKYGVTAFGQFTQTTTERLGALAQLVDSGSIKVNIDKIFPLNQVKEAFEYQEHGHPRGKVVLKIKDSV